MELELGDGSQWQTPAEVAQRFRFHIRSIHRLCRQGLLPARKFGKRRWVVDSNALERLLRSDPKVRAEPQGEEQETEEEIG